MKTATIYLSNDPTTLGPDATSDDLSRYAENLRQGAIEAFGLDECVVNVGSVSRSESDVPEIREWLRELKAGDGWLQFTGEDDAPSPVPATREEAITMLVEQDVAKWGECERKASRRAHVLRTYGLALNELANRAELSGRSDAPLRAAARAALTSADWEWLRKGG